MLASLLDLLLPARCPGCDAPGPGLCDGCRVKLERVQPACGFCAATCHGSPCRICRDRGFPHVAAALAAWKYQGFFRDLVTQAKALGQPWAVRACVNLLPSDLIPPGWTNGLTMVVPVPPSPGRRPGPHLATALARRISRMVGLPMVKGLCQSRVATPQHQLNRVERTSNVDGLFVTNRPIAGNVLLIDDLVTTGATVAECARVLRHAGAGQVKVLALARTQARLGRGGAHPVQLP